MSISPRTAELALRAMAAAWQLARRNGAPLPGDWRRALAELAAVASSGRTNPPPLVLPLPRLPEEVDVVTAAERLGVSRRAVQLRCARGSLPARRVGRSWLIQWRDDAA